MIRDNDQAAPLDDGTISGKVVLSGVGFLVTSTIWILLGFINSKEGNAGLMWLDLGLVAAHFIVGVAVLGRIRAIWLVGLLLVAASIAATFANDYYLAVVADGITGMFLFLSHDELNRGPRLSIHRR